MTAEAQAHTNPKCTAFSGGAFGAMRVVSHTTLSRQPMAAVLAIDTVDDIIGDLPSDTAWARHGVSSNARGTTNAEQAELRSKQARIGRPKATSAPLILPRKRAEWCALTQEERREILEGQSHQIAIGMAYLPAAARRLLYRRNLDRKAPFASPGFLDDAPEDEPAFDAMLSRLRATEEWPFMDREIDIRLTKSPR